MLVVRSFTLVARYILTVAHNFPLIVRYFLLAACYLYLSAYRSSLVARYFLLVARYFLLVSFHSLHNFILWNLWLEYLSPSNILPTVRIDSHVLRTLYHDLFQKMIRILEQEHAFIKPVIRFEIFFISIFIAILFLRAICNIWRLKH